MSILDYGGSAISSFVCAVCGRLRRLRFQQSSQFLFGSAVNRDTATKPDSNGWRHCRFRGNSYKFDTTELPVAEEWDGHPWNNVVHLHHASNEYFRQ
jgi:hypothetical protein